MKSFLKLVSPTLFFLFIFFLSSSAFSQDVTVIDVQMPCGVPGTPACVIEADTSGLPSPALSASEPSITPDFSLINISAPSLSFAFQFQKVSCAQPAKTTSISGGRTIIFDVDYCKVVNVFNDVVSLLAYFLTAGYLINLAFRPRGE